MHPTGVSRSDAVLGRVGSGGGEVSEADPPRQFLMPRDWVLLILIIILIGVVARDWSSYSCRVPLNVWLVSCYLSILFGRAMQLVVFYYAELGLAIGDSEENDKHRTTIRTCSWINQWIVYPFMLVWSVIGCHWYRLAHDCLPESFGSWGFICSILAALMFAAQHTSIIVRCMNGWAHTRMMAGLPSGGWSHVPSGLARIHILYVELYRNQQLAQAQRQQPTIIMVQQPILAMHHQQPQHRQQPQARQGMTADQIHAIPTRYLTPDERVNQLCSICLIEFPQLPPDPTSCLPAGPDPSVDVCEVSVTGAPSSRQYSTQPVLIRVLPCSHVFHIDCIDPWLHEKHVCPNCRVVVQPDETQTGASGSSPPPLEIPATQQQPQPQPILQQQPPPPQPSPHLLQPSIAVQPSSANPVHSSPQVAWVQPPQPFVVQPASVELHMPR